VNSKDNNELDGYKEIMTDAVIVHTVNTLTSRSGEDGAGWRWGLMGGDIVSGYEPSYQPLHTDWAAYPVNAMYWGYALVVSVAPEDIGEEFAPLRIVGWD